MSLQAFTSKRTDILPGILNFICNFYLATITIIDYRQTREKMTHYIIVTVQLLDFKTR